MYMSKPSHIYVHRRVFKNSNAVARMNHMLNALGNPSTETVDESDFERIINESLPFPDLPVLTGGVFIGIEKRQEDPTFLFNTFVWDEVDQTVVNSESPNPNIRQLARLFGGAGEDFAFSPPMAIYNLYSNHPGGPPLCNPGWGIHTLLGCLHKCYYCDKGYLMNIMLDLEDFSTHLEAFLARTPEQKLFRHDVLSDPICLEPEYGASRILNEVFSKTKDQHLLYYTKSDNVDHLLDLPKEHCIFYSTLSTETVCREIEKGTPGMAERIEAIRKCKDAGYLVRVGFSPIIPIRGWREEASACIEKLFSAVTPELIRLTPLIMMNAAETEIVIGESLLDPICLEAMRDAAPELDDADMFSKPFPTHIRKEIFLHYIKEIKKNSSDTLITLCAEKKIVWDMLKDHLTMRPDSIYCCCGARSVPELMPEYLRRSRTKVNSLMEND